MKVLLLMYMLTIGCQGNDEPIEITEEYVP